jgi:hypothetical protein
MWAVKFWFRVDSKRIVKNLSFTFVFWIEGIDVDNLDREGFMRSVQ